MSWNHEQQEESGPTESRPVAVRGLPGGQVVQQLARQLGAANGAVAAVGGCTGKFKRVTEAPLFRQTTEGDFNCKGVVTAEGQAKLGTNELPPLSLLTVNSLMEQIRQLPSDVRQQLSADLQSGSNVGIPDMLVKVDAQGNRQIVTSANGNQDQKVAQLRLSDQRSLLWRGLSPAYRQLLLPGIISILGDAAGFTEENLTDTGKKRVFIGITPGRVDPDMRLMWKVMKRPGGIFYCSVSIEGYSGPIPGGIPVVAARRQRSGETGKTYSCKSFQVAVLGKDADSSYTGKDEVLVTEGPDIPKISVTAEAQKAMDEKAQRVLTEVVSRHADDDVAEGDTSSIANSRY